MKSDPATPSSLRELSRLIREDYRSHDRDWTRPGFRALACYRFGVWRMGIRNPLLRFLPSRLYRMLFRYCRNIYGIELPYTATIGRRVVIEHQGGIVVHGNTVIGEGSIIRQNCTLGVRSRSHPDDAPIIGCDVDIGAGAVILGRIYIGDKAVIGANAVVLCDVPSGHIAVGIPAKIRLAKSPTAMSFPT